MNIGFFRQAGNLLTNYSLLLSGVVAQTHGRASGNRTRSWPGVTAHRKSTPSRAVVILLLGCNIIVGRRCFQGSYGREAGTEIRVQPLISLKARIEECLRLKAVSNYIRRTGINHRRRNWGKRRENDSHGLKTQDRIHDINNAVATPYLRISIIQFPFVARSFLLHWKSGELITHKEDYNLFCITWLSISSNKGRSKWCLLCVSCSVLLLIMIWQQNRVRRKNTILT
jgi:hypothetical protein